LTSEPSLAKPKIIPKSREIAAIGLFGALSIVLSVISNFVLKLAFVPPVSYLLFDFGEIPVIISFFILGPRSGFSVAVVEWIALNLLPTSLFFLGPLFKFLSVSLTLAGLWLGWKITKRANFKTRFVTASIVSSIVRAVVMTIPNAILLILFFHYPESSEILYLSLELTGIFNVLQIPFDFVPTYIFLELPQVRHVLRKNGMTWFELGLQKRID
jgi:riboflavin transporter FmnP